MTFGVMTQHAETVVPFRPLEGEHTPSSSQNYGLFFEFLELANISYRTLDSPSLSLEALKRFSCILIGAPTRRFRKDELSVLRNYVSSGGHLFLLFKYGGENVLQTNLNRLFPEIAVATDDIVLSNVRNHQRPYQPLLELSIHHPRFYFEGSLCYDGGCTFEVYTSDVFTIDAISAHAYLGQFPRWQDNQYQCSSHSALAKNAIGVYAPVGKGAVLYWGSRWSFSNEILKLYDNTAFLKNLLGLLDPSLYSENLHQRMQRPQRHRLLHGYPMSSGLRAIQNESDLIVDSVNMNSQKSWALGIIPHPFCNPQLPGCGFCTFPHEKYDREGVEACIRAVIHEARNLQTHFPQLTQRPLSSVYIGGGTANLIPSPSWKALCQTLQTYLPITSNTEITLEGAPVYFETKPELMEILREQFPQSPIRISFGVQTFDTYFLERMGRLILNRPNSLELGLAQARQYQMKVSCDLLVNLPGQTVEQMEADIRRAVELQIEHICIYTSDCHLLSFFQ